RSGEADHDCRLLPGRVAGRGRGRPGHRRVHALRQSSPTDRGSRCFEQHVSAPGRGRGQSRRRHGDEQQLRQGALSFEIELPAAAVSPLRTVAVTRYVTPLREGGSVPAIVEADDDGMYVLKFRGAGQGPKALIAELLAGEIGRAADLPVPEIVLIQLDADLARTEPDPEIQDLIRASGGLNVALDYPPRAVTFYPVTHQPAPALASAIVWFDAFVMNVDRTVRNTNMLMWHRQLHLIDHGAALYFHHDWPDGLQKSRAPFPQIRAHVLHGQAAQGAAALDEALATSLGGDVLPQIL